MLHAQIYLTSTFPRTQLYEYTLQQPQIENIVLTNFSFVLER